MSKQHESVFGREVFQNLNLERDSLIVDGTLGDGGHAELLLKNTTNVRVLGIDRDMRAIERAEKRLASFRSRITLVHGNFSDIKIILKKG